MLKFYSIIYQYLSLACHCIINCSIYYWPNDTIAVTVPLFISLAISYCYCCVSLNCELLLFFYIVWFIDLCYISMLYTYAIYLCYRPMLYIYAIDLCYIPMLYAYAVYLCYMPMLYIYAICLCCISMLYAYAVYLCYRPMLYIYAIDLCCISML